MFLSISIECKLCAYEKEEREKRENLGEREKTNWKKKEKKKSIETLNSFGTLKLTPAVGGCELGLDKYRSNVPEDNLGLFERESAKKIIAAPKKKIAAASIVVAKEFNLSGVFSSSSFLQLQWSCFQQ